jgi:hypothetical protein
MIRTKTVDMSPEAIDRRLRELAGLYRLGMSLQGARRLGKLRDLEQPAEREIPDGESCGSK